MSLTAFVPLAAVIVALSGFTGAGIWHFLEVNVVEPAPYELDLKECLKDARSGEDRAKTEENENTCFRKYPHFN